MFALGNKMAGEEDVRAMNILHIKMRLSLLWPMNWILLSTILQLWKYSLHNISYNLHYNVHVPLTDMS